MSHRTLCDPMDCSLPISSVGFSKQEDWSGLPFPSPGDLPNPGDRNPRLPHWQAGSLPLSHRGSLATERCHSEIILRLSVLFSQPRSPQPVLKSCHKPARERGSCWPPEAGRVCTAGGDQDEELAPGSFCRSFSGSGGWGGDGDTPATWGTQEGQRSPSASAARLLPYVSPGACRTDSAPDHVSLTP